MTYWNQKTVIVAGGAGFLGSYVVEGLRRTGVVPRHPGRNPGGLSLGPAVSTGSKE